MKNWPFLLAAVFASGLWLRSVYLQLKSGQLLARGARVYGQRDKNPILYWSTIVLEGMVAMFVVLTMFLAVLGAK